MSTLRLTVVFGGRKTCKEVIGVINIDIRHGCRYSLGRDIVLVKVYVTALCQS